MRHIISSNSKGNVLFIILIAVALFAALSYTIGDSFRGGTKTIGGEQARVAAGDLLRAMQSIKEGYNYLWNQQGCSMDDISFVKSGKAVGSITFTDTDDDGAASCEIFNTLGAGVAYPENLGRYQSAAPANQSGKFFFYFAGNEPVGAYGVENLGTSADDHMIFLNGVSTEICLQLNKLLGINHTAPIDDAGDVLGDTVGNEFDGKAAGCRGTARHDVFYVMQEL